jgi:hypothetical protein
MHRVSKNNQNVGDDCILAPLNMNRIILEIKDSSGINHGVIRFGEDNPTLRIDEFMGSHDKSKWLDYRATNTPNGRENTSNDIKIVRSKGGFYSLGCDLWVNSGNFTSRSNLECIGTKDGWITVIKNRVSESTIGLGTLLRRKEKPIIGLGSLLED